MNAHQPLPPGYRFRPTKEELVFSYLLPRIRGDQMPAGVIREVDDFYASEPRDLPGQSFQGVDETHWFLMTTRRRRQDKKQQFNRKTKEGGSWRVTGEPVRIPLAGHREVGLRRIFVFYKGGASVWAMHEFSLEKGAGEPEEPITICMLFRKDEETGRAVDPVSGKLGEIGDVTGGELGVEGGGEELGLPVELFPVPVGVPDGVPGVGTGAQKRKRLDMAVDGQGEEKVAKVEAADLGGEALVVMPALVVDPIPVSLVTDEPCLVVPDSPEVEVGEEEELKGPDGMELAPWDRDEPIVVELPVAFPVGTAEDVDSDFLADVEAVENFELERNAAPVGLVGREIGETPEEETILQQCGGTLLHGVVDGSGIWLRECAGGSGVKLPQVDLYGLHNFNTSSALGDDSQDLTGWSIAGDGKNEVIGIVGDALFPDAACAGVAPAGQNGVEEEMTESEIKRWLSEYVLDIPSSPEGSS